MPTKRSYKPLSDKSNQVPLTPEERQARLAQSSAGYLRGKIELEEYKKKLKEYGIDDNTVILENSGLIKRFLKKITQKLSIK